MTGRAEITAEEAAVVEWITGNPDLMDRGLQIIRGDERNGTGFFGEWVELLLFGSPHGRFHRAQEPKSDTSSVRRNVTRNDLWRFRWDRVTAALKPVPSREWFQT